MYVSNVTFTDSFCNSEKGWLNPTNVNNLLDKVEDDQYPYVLQTDFDEFKKDTEEHLEKHDKEIAEEIQNRKNADSKIISRMDFINEELQREFEQRQENDEILNEKIDKEIDARTKGDADVNKRIDEITKEFLFPKFINKDKLYDEKLTIYEDNFVTITFKCAPDYSEAGFSIKSKKQIEILRLSADIYMFKSDDFKVEETLYDIFSDFLLLKGYGRSHSLITLSFKYVNINEYQNINMIFDINRKGLFYTLNFDKSTEE